MCTLEREINIYVCTERTNAQNWCLVLTHSTLEILKDKTCNEHKTDWMTGMPLFFACHTDITDIPRPNLVPYCPNSCQAMH